VQLGISTNLCSTHLESHTTDNLPKIAYASRRICLAKETQLESFSHQLHQPTSSYYIDPQRLTFSSSPPPAFSCVLRRQTYDPSSQARCLKLPNVLAHSIKHFGSESIHEAIGHLRARCWTSGNLTSSHLTLSEVCICAAHLHRPL
jgi:hypothetical protein